MKSRGLILVSRVVPKKYFFLSCRALSSSLLSPSSQEPARHQRSHHDPFFKASEAHPRFFSSAHYSNDDFNGNGDRSITIVEEEYDAMANEKFEGDEDSFEDKIIFKKTRQVKELHKEQQEEYKRIWLDPSTNLSDRVNRFLNRQLGNMHPLDIKLASVDLIRECGKMKSFEGMKLAHDILDRILEEKHFVNNGSSNGFQSLIFITQRPFKVLMYGWANLCQKVTLAPQRMREILDLMIQEAEYDDKILRELKSGGADKEVLSDLQSCEPTVDIFNTLLQGLVQASFRSVAAAGEAEKVLTRMMRQNHKRKWHTKPNSKSFTLAISAYSKTRHVSAGKRAEAILRRMIQYHEQEMALYQEETGVAYDPYEVINNKRRIVTPDTVVYSAVIQAHGQSNAKGSAERSLGLLSELLEQSHKNPALTPDAFLFANTINSFARMASNKKSPKARMEAAERAEDVLWLMVEELRNLKEAKSDKAEKDEDTKPSTIEIPIVDMKKSSTGFQISVVPFNACLSAWAQSNAPKSAMRAEELLHKMLSPDLKVTPNTTSFNTCMQAWARASRKDTNAPGKAEDLLKLLTSLETDNDRIADVQSFTTVMSAYAKSKRKDKAIQCRRLFESLLSSTVVDKKQITAVPFTVLLNAVEHSSSGGIGDGGDSDFSHDSIEDDPYTIALETYRELQEDLYNLGVQVDHLSYATMLGVLEKHTSVDSVERRQRIERVFEDACSNGQVSNRLLEVLFRVCPSQDMLQSLLQTPDPKSIANVNALPREWTRHVPQKFRKLEQQGPKRYNNSSRRGNTQRKQKNKYSAEK
jgi:hypothetical protein